jgi:hypothetical protein
VLPCVPLTEEGSPTVSTNRSPLNSEPDDCDADASDISAVESQAQPEEAFESGDAEDDGDFGDEFDEFEEGGDGDDFGDFDDGFQGEEQTETTFDKPPDQPSLPAPSLGPVSENYSIPRQSCLNAYACCDPHGLTWDLRSRCWTLRSSQRLKRS